MGLSHRTLIMPFLLHPAPLHSNSSSCTPSINLLLHLFKLPPNSGQPLAFLVTKAKQYVLTSPLYVEAKILGLRTHPSQKREPQSRDSHCKFERTMQMFKRREYNHQHLLTHPGELSPSFFTSVSPQTIQPQRIAM